MGSKRRYRSTAFIAAVLAGVAGLPAIATPARADEPAPAPLTAPRTNEPPAPGEEILSLRNAYGSTFATEIPGQFRTELHPRPVNFRANGQWQPIDPTLTQVGAELRQRANDLAVSIPATGAGVTRLTFDGAHSISYGTPIGSLPSVAAVVNSSVATLPGLLTGSDLRYESRWNGVKTDIILRSPSAPTAFTFPLVTQGLTASLDSNGNIRFTDAAGVVRAVTPHGYMTDANVDPRSGDPARSDDVTYQLVNVAGVQALKVTLDAAWVHASDRQWPITVDPTLVTYAADTDDMFVQQPYTNDYSAAVELKAGTFNSGTDKARSFLHFAGVNALDGKVIDSAYFKPYEFHSYSCTRTNVSVYRITGAWAGTGNRTYPGPAVSDKIFTVTEARGYSSACPAARITFNVSGLVRNWASNTWANNGLAIIADSETDNFGWKKFDSRNGTNDPQLEVTWSEPNRAPGQVSGRSVSGNVCACSPGYTADTTPTVTGTGTDADGDQISYQFQIYSGHLTTVDASGNATTSLTPIASGTTALVNSGTQGTFTSPALANGLYSYRVRAYDGAAYGVWSSGWAQWYQDSAGPTINRIDVTPQSTESGWYSSKDASISWTPNTNVSGINGYSYVIDQSASTVPAAVSMGTGTAASATNLPEGKSYVHVRAQSKTLVWGATKNYTIQVDTVASPAPISPSCPGYSALAANSDATVDCSWTAPTDATSSVSSYLYQYSTSATRPDTTPAASDYSATATSATSMALSDGDWYFYVRAVDAAGNISSYSRVGPFTIDISGPNMPTFTSTTHPDVTGGTNTPWYANRHIDVSWTATDTPPVALPITKYQYSFNTTGGVTPTGTPTTATSFTTDVTADGQYFLDVRGIDSAGNAGAVGEYRIRVDSTAPNVQFSFLNTDPFIDGLSPNGKYWRSNSPQLNFTTTDTAPVTGYRTVVDRQPTTDPGTVGLTSTTSTYSEPGAPEGVEYLHVRAVNAAGVWSDPVHFAIRIDTIAPTAPAITSGTHPTNGAINQHLASFDWSAQAGDDVHSQYGYSGVAGYSYTFTQNNPGTPDSVVDTSATSLNQSLNDGSWYFNLAILDKAGNKTTTSYGPVLIDSSAPPVTNADRDRFISLWQPRALSETFYQNWFANPIPASILAEGFHSMSDTQKHYLGDQLWYAIQAGNPSDSGLDAAGTSALYAFVFDKDTAANPTRNDHYSSSEDGNVQETSRAPVGVPTAFTQLIAKRLAGFVPNVAAISPVVDVPDVGVPLDIEDLPTIGTADVSSALGADAQAASNALDTVVDAAQVAAEQLTEADLAFPSDYDDRALFAAPSRLPVNYSVCWDTATFDACKDSSTLGLPTDIDVTNDGTSDLTVTFGPFTPANPLSGSLPSLANLQLDVQRYAPLVPTPATPDSDLKGAAVKAHVWVVYDVPSASTSGAGSRLRLGVDGYVRGAQLSEDTSVTIALNDPLSVAAHDFDLGLDIEHTWPTSARPKWALTAALENTTGSADPIDAALTFSEGVNFTGAIKSLDDDASQSVDRTLSITSTTAGPTALTLDSHGTVSSLNETTTAHARIQSAPAGTVFTVTRNNNNGRDLQTFSVTNSSNLRAARLGGVIDVQRSTGRDLTRFDLQQPASGFTFTQDKQASGVTTYTYNADTTTGPVEVNTRTTDSNGQLTLALRAATSSLPNTLTASMGPSSVSGDDRTLLNIGTSTGLSDIAFALYSRALQLSVSGHGQRLTPILTAAVSPGAKHLDFTAARDDEPGVGLMEIAFSSGGGKINRRSGEHATLITNGNSVGASVSIHGARSGTIDRTSDIHVAAIASIDTGSSGAVPAVFAGDLAGYRFTVNVSNLPAKLKADMDVGSPFMLTATTSPTIGRMAAYAQLPGFGRLDAVARNLPSTVTLTGTVSSTGAVLDYSGSGRLGYLDRFMATLDPSASDRSGTTLLGSASDLPRNLHADLSRSLRSVSATATDQNGQPDEVGSLAVQAARNGARADVPVGQHVTLTGSPSAFAISANIQHLQSATAEIESSLARGSAEVRLSQQTGPFTAHYNVDAFRLLATATTVPEYMKLDARTDTPLVKLDGSRSISKVTGYVAKTDTGPTIYGVLEGTPTSATVYATLANPVYGVTYTSSGPTLRVAGLYTPDYAPAINPSIGQFILADAKARNNGDGTYGALPTSFNAQFNRNTKTLNWRDGQPIGEISFRGRGALLDGFTIAGSARGVPGDFDAAFQPGGKSFDGRGNKVDYLQIQASNHGSLPGRLAGRHLKATFDLANGNVDVSAELDNVGSASITTSGQSFSVTGDADSSNVKLLGKILGLVSDTASNRFQMSLQGTVVALPSTITLSASPGQATIDASSNINGQLSGSLGWQVALAAAESPSGRADGVSFTDGSCQRSSTCSTQDSSGADRFFCSDSAAKCYGVRFAASHQALPKHLELRTDLSSDDPFVKATGLAPGVFAASAVIDDFISTYTAVDLRQAGVTSNATLSLSRFKIDRGPDGVTLSAHADTSGFNGAFTGSVSLPNKSLTFGPLGRTAYTFEGPAVSFDLSNTPRTIDVNAVIGRKSDVALNTSDAIASFTASLDGVLKQTDTSNNTEVIPNPDAPTKCKAGRHCGSITLDLIPAAPDPAKPIRLHAESLKFTVEDKIYRVPTVTYSAPAAGANLTASIDKGVAVLADGDQDFYFASGNINATAKLDAVQISANRLAQNMTVGASSDLREVAITSGPEQTGGVGFYTPSVHVLADGLQTTSPVYRAGPVDFKVRMGGRLTVDANDVYASLTEFTSSVIRLDEYNVAAGIDGSYKDFTIEMHKSPSFAIDKWNIAPGVSLHPNILWSPDLFLPQIPLPFLPTATLHDFHGAVIKADESGNFGPCLGGALSLNPVSIQLTLTPNPKVEDYVDKNVLYVDGSKGRQIFMPNPFGTSRISSRLVAFAMATVYNPWNNTSVGVDFKGPLGCL